MIDRELVFVEYNALRQELRDLKKCQVTFLTFSVTATGVLLGLGSKYGTLTDLISPGIIYLFPLTIIIPFWWIFFDKSITIIRLVGYFRLLENAVTKPWAVRNFLGWENAIAEFREKQKRHELSFQLIDTSGHAAIREAHRLKRLREVFKSNSYTLMTFSTFFGLALLCLALSYGTFFSGAIFSFKALLFNHLPFTIASVIVAVSTVWNAKIVYNIAYNRNYVRTNEAWREILKYDEHYFDNLISSFKEIDDCSYQDALRKLIENKPASIDPLIAALSNESARVRVGACKALGEIRETETIPYVINCMRNDSDSAVVIAAKKSLTRMGTFSVEPLVEALSDNDEFFREEVKSILVTIGVPAAGSLSKAVRDDNPVVREKAQEALDTIIPPVPDSL
ncbi:MAG: HEAT repeat domain-containing protein [Thermoleophilia bacterium]|jgi:hypothetical protein